VPNAPGVPAVNRTSISVDQAVVQLSSLAGSVSQVSALAAGISPAFGGQLAAASTAFSDASTALSAVSSAADQLKTVNGLAGVVGAVGSISQLVTIADPVLGSQIGAVANTATSVVNQVKQLIGQKPKPKATQDAPAVASKIKIEWGVFTKSGALALFADSFVSVSYDAEHRIADYPIEKGGFESYDKVAMPFDVTVKLTRGGSVSDRRKFVAAIEKMRLDRELYNVLTPEYTYMNVNISRVSFDRTRENGSGLLTALLHLREIRQSGKAKLSVTKNPGSESVSNGGSVQPKPANAPAGVK
jgi:hypothetical protein